MSLCLVMSTYILLIFLALNTDALPSRYAKNSADVTAQWTRPTSLPEVRTKIINCDYRNIIIDKICIEYCDWDNRRHPSYYRKQLFYSVVQLGKRN